MRQLLLAGFVATGMVTGSPLLYSHGGQFTQPPVWTPPAGGSGGGAPGLGGPSTPGPSGPSGPGPAGPSIPGGPSTGGPAGRGGGGAPGPTTGRGGIELEDDFTTWQYWWEFNKDPFLNLKKAIHTGGTITGSDDYFLGRTVKADSRDTLKPSERDILDRVVPKLIQALESKQRDIVSSSLVALAKTGLEEDKVIPLIRKLLSDSDQEIAETATLALGILAKPAVLNDLINIAEDNKDGRRLTGSQNGINYRTRSFATYGLGLVAHANAHLYVKEKVLRTLGRLVADARLSQRDIKIAAVNALGLLNVSPQEGRAAEALYRSVIETLLACYDAKEGVAHLVQAHVPAAIAKLAGRSLDPGGTLKKRFLTDLVDTRKADWIRQSCALALGQMAKPDEPEYSNALQDYYRSGKDQQARYFSLMSVGQIGGERNRAFLLEQVEGAKRIDQAWAAIALGVLAFDLRRVDATAGVDRTAGDAVRRQLQLTKNRDVLAGLCVALGLLQYTDAAGDVMQILEEKSSDDDLAGYACLGLGLMGHQAAKDQIRSLAEDSARRANRLKQAAIALGLMGDKTMVETLIKLLKNKGTSLASQAGIATALGSIGDARSIDPLAEMLHNQDLTPLARAFASVALGIVADKENLPWNSKIAVNLNYRANTETLTNQISGILDIL